MLGLLLLSCAALIGAVDGLCTRTAAEARYRCDCEFQYTCKQRTGITASNSDLKTLMRLSHTRSSRIYLTGRRQTTKKNQADFCKIKCVGRAFAALGPIIRPSEENLWFGRKHLALILDILIGPETANTCCGVFIASKRAWCDDWSWTHYDEFKYYKYEVMDPLQSIMHSFYNVQHCTDNNPFPDGLEAVPAAP